MGSCFVMFALLSLIPDHVFFFSPWAAIVHFYYVYVFHKNVIVARLDVT